MGEVPRHISQRTLQSRKAYEGTAAAREATSPTSHISNSRAICGGCVNNQLGDGQKGIGSGRNTLGNQLLPKGPPELNGRWVTRERDTVVSGWTVPRVRFP